MDVPMLHGLTQTQYLHRFEFARPVHIFKHSQPTGHLKYFDSNDLKRAFLVAN